jgi:hypothetical protein
VRDLPGQPRDLPVGCPACTGRKVPALPVECIMSGSQMPWRRLDAPRISLPHPFFRTKPLNALWRPGADTSRTTEQPVSRPSSGHRPSKTSQRDVDRVPLTLLTCA